MKLKPGDIISHGSDYKLEIVSAHKFKWIIHPDHVNGSVDVGIIKTTTSNMFNEPFHEVGWVLDEASRIDRILDKYSNEM